MLTETNQANIERFSGFADCYDQYRPVPPQTIIKIITQYLDRYPEFVVDVGCGTGLSTFIWEEHAERILGIEPNPDMLMMAMRRQSQRTGEKISFRKGLSNDTGLSSESVDVVTCSQSFHWMEPVSTLAEFARILKPGGIFAVYDCDWPPMIDWVIEKEYNKLLARVHELSFKNENKNSLTVKQWSKNNHIKNIQESQRFCFAREVVFHSADSVDADRMIGIALSQGGIQDLLKTKDTTIEKEIEAFKEVVRERLGGQTFGAIFGYRMRLGIK